MNLTKQLRTLFHISSSLEQKKLEKEIEVIFTIHCTAMYIIMCSFPERNLHFSGACLVCGAHNLIFGTLTSKSSKGTATQILLFPFLVLWLMTEYLEKRGGNWAVVTRMSRAELCPGVKNTQPTQPPVNSSSRSETQYAGPA